MFFKRRSGIKHCNQADTDLAEYFWYCKLTFSSAPLFLSTVSYFFKYSGVGRSTVGFTDLQLESQLLSLQGIKYSQNIEAHSCNGVSQSQQVCVPYTCWWMDHDFASVGFFCLVHCFSNQIIHTHQSKLNLKIVHRCSTQGIAEEYRQSFLRYSILFAVICLPDRYGKFLYWKNDNCLKGIDGVADSRFGSFSAITIPDTQTLFFYFYYLFVLMFTYFLLMFFVESVFVSFIIFQVLPHSREDN